MNPMMSDAPNLITLLQSWVERGWLRELDLALARFLLSEAPATTAPVLLAAALVSHQLGRGHVCLDLDDTLANPGMALSLPPEHDSAPEETPVVPPETLLASLEAVGWAALLDASEVVSSGDGNTPLVLISHRLYLRRYWRYEREVETAILQRLGMREPITASLPVASFRQTLRALFPSSEPGHTDWQKIACALAARSAFSIITGGPGTGKTTTVVRLLALLQSLALENSARPLRIRLAAPTGKAAARLKDSISGAVGSLPGFVQANAALLACIPDEVTTLHRLLGSRPDSRLFRHNARNPLPLDVLVVDEASMVDLEMMAALLSALPSQSRLILLGDKDQLASVEAGSVLGDLCRRALEGHFTPATAKWVLEVSGEPIDAAFIDPAGHAFDQHVLMLRQSRRFAASSGIGQLASAVNAGRADAISAIWQSGHADIIRHDLPGIDTPKLEEILLGKPGETEGPHGYAAYLDIVRKERPPLKAARKDFDAWARRVLKAHSRFQLLCALRKGPCGVSGLNAHIENMLRAHGLIDGFDTWYAGRPVLVTRNDYNLDLMNGDIGITLPFASRNRETGEAGWSMRVAFPAQDGSGGIHWILPSRLQSAETVFALTVHKSQGSEFEHCALLLPPHTNPILTRELVYTGVTRARQWFSLICAGNPMILNLAASRSVQRSGGLLSGL